MFSKNVSDQLKYYVYRLIDPRNGETFYVGKGTGNRVFEHVRDRLNDNKDEVSNKIRRIREIIRDAFEVGHVIHRHGLEEKEAFEVEAALLDAYPGTTNLVGGHDSGERGAMHANQIVELYEAKEAVFKHKVILININRSVLEHGNLYEAVRFSWKIDPKKAARAEAVLAVQQGLILDAFVANEWLKATPENFPGVLEYPLDRYGFIGHQASEEIRKLYVRRRVPDAMRKRGAANPVRYSFA